MKRRVLIVAVLVLVASLAVSGTLAYYTKDVTADNVVTAGNVTARLQLTQAAAGGSESPASRELAVLPGTECSRILRVENIGRAPAWVRVKVEVDFRLPAGREGEPDPGLVRLRGLDETRWTFADGYYYYNEALQPGVRTEPLFTGLAFDGAMGDLYQSGAVHLAVALEAVQTAHNGESAREAAGWPQA